MVAASSGEARRSPARPRPFAPLNPASAPAPTETAAEYRQVSVMFCGRPGRFDGTVGAARSGSAGRTAAALSRGVRGGGRPFRRLRRAVFRGRVLVYFEADAASRVRERMANLPADFDLFPILYALWLYYGNVPDFAAQRDLSRGLLTLGAIRVIWPRRHGVCKKGDDDPYAQPTSPWRSPPRLSGRWWRAAAAPQARLSQPRLSADPSAPRRSPPADGRNAAVRRARTRRTTSCRSCRGRRG